MNYFKYLIQICDMRLFCGGGGGGSGITTDTTTGSGCATQTTTCSKVNCSTFQNAACATNTLIPVGGNSNLLGHIDLGSYVTKYINQIVVDIGGLNNALLSVDAVLATKQNTKTDCENDIIEIGIRVGELGPLIVGKQTEVDEAQTQLDTATTIYDEYILTSEYDEDTAATYLSTKTLNQVALNVVTAELATLNTELTDLNGEIVDLGVELETVTSEIDNFTGKSDIEAQITDAEAFQASMVGKTDSEILVLGSTYYNETLPTSDSVSTTQTTFTNVTEDTIVTNEMINELKASITTIADAYESYVVDHLTYNNSKNSNTGQTYCQSHSGNLVRHSIGSSLPALKTRLAKIDGDIIVDPLPEEIYKVINKLYIKTDYPSPISATTELKTDLDKKRVKADHINDLIEAYNDMINHCPCVTDCYCNTECHCNTNCKCNYA
jgi:hypothetical protein